MKAGHSFVCVICKESAPEGEASTTPQFTGPVCEECRRNALWAEAYLKKAKITRPICTADINGTNAQRFSL